MRKSTADALERMILHGDPDGQPFTIKGVDAFGNPVEEVVDPRKSLSEMLGVPVHVIRL